jgi:mono/diheme cytochrome c family protein
MKGYASYRRTIITISIITAIVFLLTKCINEQKEEGEEQPEVQEAINVVKREQFAGSAACASCHKDIHDRHKLTAHYLTTMPATEESIKGSFDSGKNSFVFNDRVKVMMEKRDSGFYQVAYLNQSEKQSRRFDIVVGSGTKGQSYLNWIDNNLFQMPITYFTPERQWSNSPGYPGKVVFNRPITSRCLECHSTFVEKLPSTNKEPEEFDRNKIIYGVDCEKCHGPAASHVEFQSKNPRDTVAKHVINPSKLSRQQNLDLCALCHGGRLRKTKESFGFKVGDKLADYFAFDTAGKNTADIDVHGNQYGLLAASKCFKMSEMTCSSCHNPHQNEKGRIAAFSQRCSSCHNNEHKKQCKMKPVLGSAINQNCIDCHMPRQPSRSIAVLLQRAQVPTAVLMRTHLIKIYPDETKKVMEKLK